MKHHKGRELLDLLKNQDMKQQNVPRQTQCIGQTCAKGQMATLWVNRDARSIDLEALPYDKVVVVGSMRLKAGVRQKERLYGLGNDLGEPEDARRFFFIAYKPSRTDKTLTNWVLYGMHDDHGWIADSLVSGKIVKCVKEHDTNHEVPNAWFRNCDADIKSNALARLSHVSADTLLALQQCTAGPSECARRARRALTATASLSVTQRQSVVQALEGIYADSSIDPFWFTCLLGCCTAEMP